MSIAGAEGMDTVWAQFLRWFDEVIAPEEVVVLLYTMARLAT